MVLDAAARSDLAGGSVERRRCDHAVVLVPEVVARAIGRWLRRVLLGPRALSYRLLLVVCRLASHRGPSTVRGCELDWRR